MIYLCKPRNQLPLDQPIRPREKQSQGWVAVPERATDPDCEPQQLEWARHRGLGPGQVDVYTGRLSCTKGPGPPPHHRAKETSAGTPTWPRHEGPRSTASPHTPFIQSATARPISAGESSWTK